MHISGKLKLICAILLAIISNKMVNVSDNWYFGSKHPEIYLLIVIIGIILSFGLQVIGAWIILEKIEAINQTR